MLALTLTKIKLPLVIQEQLPIDPTAGEVVVRLKAAALNRRDYWVTQGMYPGIEPPVVLGSDGAGIIDRVGGGVDAALVGREVIINPGCDWGTNQAAHQNTFTILGVPRNGTFANEVAVPAAQIHNKPDHLNWEEAAALPLAGVTAYRAVFSQGQLQPNENVLITGIGGGVATMALQFAVAAGAKVWVTSSSEDKIQRAIELQASGGSLYTSDGWAKDLGKSFKPQLIVDSAGGSGFGNLINIADNGARIVNYGATAGPPEKLDLFKVFWKQIRIQGTTMGSPADFAAMLEFVVKHQIHPVIDSAFPLSDGNAAVEQMKISPQFGKYVLRIDA